MRIYELIFIVKPDLPEEEINSTVETVEEAITSGGATIDKTDRWGKRKLAYKVQKYSDGYYVLIQYSLEGVESLPKEIERRLRVADQVIKFMTVRIDEDLQRLAKLKARRDARAARKPQAPPPPPERPAPKAPATPATPGAPADSGDAPAAKKSGEEEE